MSPSPTCACSFNPGPSYETHHHAFSGARVSCAPSQARIRIEQGKPITCASSLPLPTRWHLGSRSQPPSHCNGRRRSATIDAHITPCAISRYEVWRATSRPSIRERRCRQHGCSVQRTFGGQPHIYTPEQVRLMMKRARQLPHRTSYAALRPLTLETMIGLVFCTGLRPAEVCKLRLADFDPRAHTMVIIQTKFSPQRTLPLHSTVVRALERYQKARTTDHSIRRSFLCQPAWRGLSHQRRLAITSTCSLVASNPMARGPWFALAICGTPLPPV